MMRGERELHLETLILHRDGIPLRSESPMAAVEADPELDAVTSDAYMEVDGEVRGLCYGADYKFAHAAEHDLGGRYTMLDSYHCSRYNTNTRRLTTEMFRDVFARARDILGGT